MIDLSNNNGSVSFATLRAHTDQHLVYLKCSEGATFTDPTFVSRLHDALSAGMKVGAYHFARPSKHTPREEATHFLRLVPQLIPGKHLRHCLDLEDPDYHRDPHLLAAWVREWLRIVHDHEKYHAIIYGSPGYLEPIRFPARPALLWEAAFGRNDGKEYPFTIPYPWTRHTVIAHQFASQARVPGVSGLVDLSRVMYPGLIEVRRFHARHT